MTSGFRFASKALTDETQRHQLTYVGTLAGHWQPWLPLRGSVLITLLMIGALLWAQDAGTPGTIAYQGRLAGADGNSVTDTVDMISRSGRQRDDGWV